MRLETFGTRLVRDHGPEIDIDTDKLVGPKDVARVMTALYDDAQQEHFVAFMVDSRYRIRGMSVITMGTVDASLIHPRETFRAAILTNAAGVVLAHNHPSGDPSPSSEDRRVMRLMEGAGDAIGIPVIDFVISGHDGRFWSADEQGVM